MLNDSTRRLAAAQHRDLHQHNLSLVLQALRDRSTSRSEIAQRTGLTLTTVGRLAATLIDLGLLTSSEPTHKGRGRPASRLSLSKTMVCYGIEVTADDITLVELTLAGRSRLLQRRPVPHAPSPEQLADLAAELVNTATRKARASDWRPFGVGLAVPGQVNHRDDLIGVSASLGWRNVPLTVMVSERLTPPLPVVMDSRAHCHALAQSDRLPGARHQTLVHLEVDLTIGAGIVVGGRPQRGSQGYAGNIGHIPLDPHGPSCQCGNAGCLEALAGLRRLAGLAGLSPTPPVPPNTEALPRDLLVDQLVARATSGDPQTLEALRTVGHWLGVGCVGVLHTLDPDVISIGGYPPRLERWLLPHARAAIDDLAQNDYVAAHELVMAPERSGIARGAATMSLHSLLADPLAAPTGAH